MLSIILMRVAYQERSWSAERGYVLQSGEGADQEVDWHGRSGPH